MSVISWLDEKLNGPVFVDYGSICEQDGWNISIQLRRREGKIPTLHIRWINRGVQEGIFCFADPRTLERLEAAFRDARERVESGKLPNPLQRPKPSSFFDRLMSVEDELDKQWGKVLVDYGTIYEDSDSHDEVSLALRRRDAQYPTLTFRRDSGRKTNLYEIKATAEVLKKMETAIHDARNHVERLNLPQAPLKVRNGTKPSADETTSCIVRERAPRNEREQIDIPMLPGTAKLTVASLVLANLVPLAGVYFWRWEVFPLVLLFWTENLIIGTINVLKMAAARQSGRIARLFSIAFFCGHYGFFCVIHGVFLAILFGRTNDPDIHFFWTQIQTLDLRWAVLGLVASHGISFVANYLYAGEFRRASAGNLMMEPYRRIVAMQVTIVVGGILMMALKSPVPGLVMLVIAKIAMDVFAHLRERKKYSVPRALLSKQHARAATELGD